MSLSATGYLEKNKLSTTHAWIILLEVTLPDTTVIRICDNSEDVTWPVSGGNLYTAFPFELDEIGDTAKGEVQSVALRVGNVTRTLEPYMEDSNGMVGSIVNIYVVNATNVTTATLGSGINNSNPEQELEYEIISASADSMWATFIFGSSNPYNKRFPRNRIMRNLCRYKAFKGAQCKYSGSETECDRTLETCRDTYSNSENFGGFPGIGSKGIYV